VSEPERIAKRLARAGLCSRRDAERWIAAGRVKVDGEVLQSPACIVTDSSRIEVDGKPLPEAERPRLWRYHKPPGEIVTAHDPQGRRTIFESLPKSMPRTVAVGRLDFNSEGLLLLTNDGGLARRLELPANGWTRRYRARVHGAVDEQRLAELVTNLYLAEGKKRSKMWETAREILTRMKVPASRVEHILTTGDPAILAEVVKEVQAGTLKRSG